VKKEWLWAILSLIIAIVLAYVLVSIAKDEPRAELVVAASKYDDHIDELERQAIDEAFKKYIGQLYNIWVTDQYQPKIPPKALTGARNARDAYIRSMDAIEKRELPPRTKAP
jgi:hypothetical protein